MMRSLVLFFLAVSVVSLLGAGCSKPVAPLVTEGKINCSDPRLASPEPLPVGGVLMEELINAEDTYWACPAEGGGFDRYYFQADGRMSGNVDNAMRDQHHLDFLEACQSGVRPPNFMGDWTTVTKEGSVSLCARLDAVPGLVHCSPMAMNPEGAGFTTTTPGTYINQGKVILQVAQNVEEGYCTLKQIK